MDSKVILSPRAIQDLRKIVRYISFDNSARAESFGHELTAQTRLLVTFPEMGHVVPEFNQTDVGK
jgi:toxin ParE1/3/4